MAGTTTFPTSVDSFALTSPTRTGTADSSGRTHSQRHEDVAAAVMALENALISATGALKILMQAGAVGTPSISFTGDTNTGIYSPGADQIALVTGGVARLVADSAGLLSGTGTSLGAWTSYTPTLGGFAIGDGTAAGAYCKIGKTVIFRARIVMGASSTFGGIPTVTIPENAKTGFGGFNFISYFKDASTTKLYPALADPATGLVTLYGLDSSGTYLVMNTTSSTVPFTWTTSDEIRVFGTYEVA